MDEYDIKQDKDFGVVKIKLADVVQSRGLSQTKFCQMARMQASQYKDYSQQTIKRVDLALVSRICSTLNCTLSDILEYIPPEKAES